VEEDIERLDVTEVICIDKIMENEKNKEKILNNKPICFDQNDLIDCPELNNNVDHVLNGTMHQVSASI